MTDESQAPRFCGECGSQLRQDARFCAECGHPVANSDTTSASAAGPSLHEPVADESTHVHEIHAGATQQFNGPVEGSSSSTPPHQPLQPAPVHPSGATTAFPDSRPTAGDNRTKVRALWIAAGAAVVLAVGGGGALLFWPDGQHDPGTASGIVQLSDNPALRWQKSAQDLAPELGCSRTDNADSAGSSSDNPYSTDDASTSTDSTSGSPTCTLIAGAVGERVVAQVTSSTTDNASTSTSSTVVVGLDEDGNKKWSVKRPETDGVLCALGQTRVWCVTGTSRGSGTGTDGATQPPRKAYTYELDTGKQLGATDIPGSSEAGGFVEATPDSLYLAGTDDSAAATYTVSKLSDEGKIAWKRIVGLGKDESPNVEVSNGKAYVINAASAGKQVIINDDSGELEQAGQGRIVAVNDGVVISRTGDQDDDPLNVGSALVAYDRVGEFGSYDKVPPLVLGSSSSSDDSDSSSDSTTYHLVNRDEPGKSLRQLQGSPVAYCGGTILTLKSTTYYGLDQESGAIKWQHPGKKVSGVECSAKGPLFRADKTLTGVDADSGQTTFSTALPASINTDSDGYFSMPVAPEVERSGLALTGRALYYVR